MPVITPWPNDYHEAVAGSPVIKRTLKDGSTLTLIVRGPWEHREAFEAALYSTHRVCPYTSWAVVLASECHGQGHPRVDPATGNNLYDDAVFTIEYGPRPSSAALAIQLGLDDSWYAQITYNVQHQTRPGRSLTWLDGTSVEVDQVKVICTEEITLTKTSATELPSVGTLRGKINDGAMFFGSPLEAASETVLFTGAQLSHKLTTDGLFEYSLKFIHREASWNKGWRDKNSAWEAISPAPYQEANLGNLLR